jgi:hypothetical protein
MLCCCCCCLSASFARFEVSRFVAPIDAPCCWPCVAQKCANAFAAVTKSGTERESTPFAVRSALCQIARMHRIQHPHCAANEMRRVPLYCAATRQTRCETRRKSLQFWSFSLVAFSFRFLFCCSSCAALIRFFQLSVPVIRIERLSGTLRVPRPRVVSTYYACSKLAPFACRSAIAHRF